MISGTSELQKAVFSVLSGDAALGGLLGGARIYDAAPDNAAFPYVTFGRISTTDWSTATERGSEHFVTLHCWSRGKGKKQALAIADAVVACLDDAALPLDGHHLVSLSFLGSETAYDDRFLATRGVVRFRAVTEPVE